MDQTGVTVFTGSEDSSIKSPGRRSGSQAALLLRHYKIFGGRGSPECSQCLGRNNHCGQLHPEPCAAVFAPRSQYEMALAAAQDPVGLREVRLAFLDLPPVSRPSGAPAHVKANGRGMQDLAGWERLTTAPEGAACSVAR